VERMNILDSNKPVFRTVMDIYSSLSENLCPSTHPITVLRHSVITQTASFSNCMRTHTYTQQFSHSYKKCRRYLKTLQVRHMGMGTLGHLSQKSKPRAVIKVKSDLLEDIIPLEARTDGICCDMTACSMGWM
jgi:hypothetical protein